jgi:acyl transferase domain-containing protein
MGTRIAFVVADAAELASMLDAAIESGRDAGFAADGSVYFAADGNAAVRGLTAGESGGEVVALLAQQGSVEKMAALWAHGARIDWRLLRRSCKPRLVPLPTYPFQKRSYWWSEGVPAIPLSAPHEALVAEPAPPAAPAAGTAAEFETWIRHLVAHVLALEPEQVTAGTDLREIGMDSIGMFKLRRGLAEQFSIELSGRDLLRQSTVRSIARLVSERKRLAAEVEAPPAPAVEADAPPAPELENQSTTAEDFATEALEQFKTGSLSVVAIRELLAEGKIA